MKRSVRGGMARRTRTAMAGHLDWERATISKLTGAGTALMLDLLCGPLSDAAILIFRPDKAAAT